MFKYDFSITHTWVGFESTAVVAKEIKRFDSATLYVHNGNLENV